MSLTCKDVMVPNERQIIANPDDTIAEVYEKIKEKRVRFVPVVDGDGRYLGVFASATLMKLLLPDAVTIHMDDHTSSTHVQQVGFMNLTMDDFKARVKELGTHKVTDHLSDADNIPVLAPDTPIMQGLMTIYQFKRHVMLVEPDTNRFVGMLSSNSVLDSALTD